MFVGGKPISAVMKIQFWRITCLKLSRYRNDYEGGRGGQHIPQWAKLFESGSPKISDKFQIFDKSYETLNLYTLITL